MIENASLARIHSGQKDTDQVFYVGDGKNFEQSEKRRKTPALRGRSAYYTKNVFFV